MDKKSRTTYEKDHPDFRPEINSTVENMEQYDEVFVGFLFGGMLLLTLLILS